MAVAVSGCVASGGEDPYANGGSGGSTGDLNTDVQAIFTRSCATSGCHAGPTPQAGLSLEADVAFDQLINVPGTTCTGDRVAPGNPDASCLWHQVDSNLMPVGNPLPDAEKQVIKNWILSLDATGTGGTGGTGTGGSGGTGGTGGEGGAGGAGGAGGSEPVTLTVDIQPIFNSSCTGCHGGTVPSGGLSLVASKAYDQLVNVACGPSTKRVDPGNLDTSCLWSLVESNQMPERRTPLTTAQKDLIRRWIEGGAQR